MTIFDYKSGEVIGTSFTLNEEEYEAFLKNDNTKTGAVRAGDWIDPDELDSLGISPDLTIYAE